jgi:predicted metal-dependent phosphoesterase TrpH
MLIDLHTHTTAYSACSAVSADDLIVAARAAGLDAVCLTEHDVLWPLPAVQELAERHEFTVLRGVEVTTEVGHVLVYGLSSWRRGLGTLRDLEAFVREQGGLMFLAHPSRRYGRPAEGEVLAAFDSLEIANASEGALQNVNAAALARACRLPGIGGSDAHTAREVGLAATRLAKPVTSEEELVKELRKGRHLVEARSRDEEPI